MHKATLFTAILVIFLNCVVGCSKLQKIQGVFPTTHPPVYEFSTRMGSIEVRSMGTKKFQALNNRKEYSGSLEEKQFLELTNAERNKAGLPSLKINKALMSMAHEKAHDMVANSYFSHTSPVYGSPFDMIMAWQIAFRAAGENIVGIPTVTDGLLSLMGSPGHRMNILNSQYTDIGVGVVEGGPYGRVLVQEFVHL